MPGKHVHRGLRELVPREQLADDVDGYAARLSSTLTVHYKFVHLRDNRISHGTGVKYFRVNGKREITLGTQRKFIIPSLSERNHIYFYIN